MNTEDAAGAGERSLRLDVAIAAGLEAAELILNYYRGRDLGVEQKSDDTPVTLADRGAERLLRDRIQAAFPEDGILGEEYGESPGRSGYRWILDPIDGTRSFVHRVPLFGTLIGVEWERRAVVGVCLFPALGEYLYASAGKGAWFVPRPGVTPERCRVSETSRLADGLFCATSPHAFEEAKQSDIYDQLWRRSKITRGWSDCYPYALVARGLCEAVVDPRMGVWDCAALQPIVEEAGGTFTDWNGVPTIHSPHAVGTNGRVLEEVLALTRGRLA